MYLEACKIYCDDPFQTVPGSIPGSCIPAFTGTPLLMTLVSQSRVKSYLRGTMKQEMLNNLMIHKEHTDELDLKQVANDFVSIKQ